AEDGSRCTAAAGPTIGPDRAEDINLRCLQHHRAARPATCASAVVSGAGRAAQATATTHMDDACDRDLHAHRREQLDRSAARAPPRGRGGPRPHPPPGAPAPPPAPPPSRSTPGRSTPPPAAPPEARIEPVPALPPSPPFLPNPAPPPPPSLPWLG